MKENKTQPTDSDVAAFFATLDEMQRDDCETLTALIADITHEKPVLWGSAIVGFGKQHYTYASGREGDWMKIGFAPRKGQLSLYATCDLSIVADLLEDLGKHTTGKGCIYIKHLADINTEVLKELIRAAYTHAGEYATN